MMGCLQYLEINTGFDGKLTEKLPDQLNSSNICYLQYLGMNKDFYGKLILTGLGVC